MPTINMLKDSVPSRTSSCPLKCILVENYFAALSNAMPPTLLSEQGLKKKSRTEKMVMLNSFKPQYIKGSVFSIYHFIL